LGQACSDDPHLRAEVQGLLDQQADSFLESAPVSAIKALSTGAKLGNFEIVELIGRGGMGEVWRARDARLKRDVAIKVLTAALARDPDRIARFEREARAASALNHANIVSVFDIGRDNGTYWIASELVSGNTLRRMIEAGRTRTYRFPSNTNNQLRHRAPPGVDSRSMTFPCSSSAITRRSAI